jgi:hypothetical protein
MPFRCKQTFLREEKCLLDHLSPFWDFPQSVLQFFIRSDLFAVVVEVPMTGNYRYESVEN